MGKIMMDEVYKIVRYPTESFSRPLTKEERAKIDRMLSDSMAMATYPPTIKVNDQKDATPE
jgi:hypothetical protein